MGFDTAEVRCEVHCIKEAFPRATINSHGAVDVEPQAKQGFGTYDCENKKDVQAKVLERLSKGACKVKPYWVESQNKSFRKYMQKGINTYLGTDFTQEDFEKIHDRIGNRINHELTLKFIDSGYNMDVLK